MVTGGFGRAMLDEAARWSRVFLSQWALLRLVSAGCSNWLFFRSLMLWFGITASGQIWSVFSSVGFCFFDWLFAFFAALGL